MARPRVNALRFAKGRHYGGTLCTSTWSMHSWSPGMAPETAVRDADSRQRGIKKERDRVGFMTSDERRAALTTTRHVLAIFG